MIVISIKLKKIFAAVCMLAVILAGPAQLPAGGIADAAVITASAAASAVTPKLSVPHVYSNKIELKVDNLSSYSSSAEFKFIVNGRYAKTYSCRTLKKKNLVSLFDDGSRNFKADTKYTVRCVAINGGKAAQSKTMSINTDSFTYYKINAKTQLYKLSGGKFTRSSKIPKVVYAKGVLCDSKGNRIAGKSAKNYKSAYLLINEGDHKGKYVKTDSNILRVTERTAKIQKVVQYAVGMNGGRYVWGGASYRACDCTGLTMLSYRQIGVDISHSTYVQARKGKASSMKNIKTGDVIICNNYGHAALYIGDGKIIHAMNSYYGIRIQDISKLSYCGRVNCVRTII